MTISNLFNTLASIFEQNPNAKLYVLDEMLQKREITKLILDYSAENGPEIFFDYDPDEMSV